MHLWIMTDATTASEPYITTSEAEYYRRRGPYFHICELDVPDDTPYLYYCFNYENGYAKDQAFFATQEEARAYAKQFTGKRRHNMRRFRTHIHGKNRQFEEMPPIADADNIDEYGTVEHCAFTCTEAYIQVLQERINRIREIQDDMMEGIREGEELEVWLEKRMRAPMGVLYWDFDYKVRDMCFEEQSETGAQILPKK